MTGESSWLGSLRIEYTYFKRHSKNLGSQLCTYRYAHVEHAKSHAVNGHDAYLRARAMRLRAGFWHNQHRFEEAKSEALRAVDAFEKLGAGDGVKDVIVRSSSSRLTVILAKKPTI